MTKRAQSKLWRLNNWTDNTKRSYPEPVNPPITSLYRVLNNEVGYFLQGNTTPNGVEDSATVRSNAAKADWIMLQGKWPSAASAEATYIGQLRAIRPGLKILAYIDPRWTYNSDSLTSDTAGRAIWATLNTNGAPSLWKTKNAAGVTMAFAGVPNDSTGTNWTVTASSTNSLGQTLWRALRLRWQELSQWQLYDGIMFDDMNAIPGNLVVPGSTTPSDWSYLQNGINYPVSDYTFTNAWRDGIKALTEEFRSISSTFLMQINTDLGFSYLQYRFPFSFSGGGRPPTPFSSTPLYALVDIPSLENGFAFNGLGDSSGPFHTYPIRSWFNLSNIYLNGEFYYQSCRPASENRMGAQVAFINQQMPLSSTEPAQQIDYTYARSCWAITKLGQGLGIGLVRSSNAPFFLDETTIKLGAAIGTRSMGTLNQPPNESNDPCTFTIRAPNATNGSATFHWQEFENALVVSRTDITGLTPGSSSFGDGTAVSYTLPSAGVGYKWQRPNCATYVNPDYSDLAMQNQSPSFNNGADATTSSLKPLHGEVFLRVVDQSAAVMNTRFDGISLVEVADYSPNSKDYGFSGTDTSTGQVFSSTSPQIWGGQWSSPRLQLINNSTQNVPLDTAWIRTFNSDGLAITRTIPYVGVPQCMYRIFPDMSFAQQGMVYIRGKIKLPVGMTGGDGFFLMLAEVKYNYTDRKLQLGLGYDGGSNKWYLNCSVQGGLGSSAPYLWGTGSTPNRICTPTQDAFYTSPNGDISIFSRYGAFGDDPTGGPADYTRWYTYEFAFRLQSPNGLVSGNAPSGWVWAATSVGSPSAPPANQSGVQRFYIRGSNMFVEPDPGATIIFPFGHYSNMGVTNLPFTWRQIEVYDRWPTDASPHPVDAT